MQGSRKDIERIIRRDHHEVGSVAFIEPSAMMPGTVYVFGINAIVRRSVDAQAAARPWWLRKLMEWSDGRA